jgi:hypothetical protein
MNESQIANSKYKLELEQIHNQLESARRREKGAVDMTMAQYVKARFGVTMQSFMEELGVDPCQDTVANLFTLPDKQYRFLIPEIMREAVRLGLRKTPIYPNVIAAEQQVSGLTVHMPSINMSDATPRKVNEAETIPLGDISYGKKDVTIYKVGRGISMSYEVRDYVSLNVVSIFLQDFGVKLGQALDTLLIDILINGEQAGGAASAPVIGVATPGAVTYRDYLKIWIRFSRLGRNANTLISGEDMALDTLDLPEFKDRKTGTTDARLNMKTPVPNTADHFIHSAVPDNQTIILDPDSAVIKLNAKPLLIESEKIISNQTLATYASLTTGFSTLYRDARVILDSSLDFGSNGFPDYMDPSLQEIVPIVN